MTTSVADDVSSSDQASSSPSPTDQAANELRGKVRITSIVPNQVDDALFIKALVASINAAAGTQVLLDTDVAIMDKQLGSAIVFFKVLSRTEDLQSLGCALQNVAGGKSLLTALKQEDFELYRFSDLTDFTIELCKDCTAECGAAPRGQASSQESKSNSAGGAAIIVPVVVVVLAVVIVAIVFVKSRGKATSESVNLDAQTVAFSNPLYHDVDGQPSINSNVKTNLGYVEMTPGGINAGIINNPGYQDLEGVVPAAENEYDSPRAEDATYEENLSYTQYDVPRGGEVYSQYQEPEQRVGYDMPHDIGEEGEYDTVNGVGYDLVDDEEYDDGEGYQEPQAYTSTGYDNPHSFSDGICQDPDYAVGDDDEDDVGYMKVAPVDEVEDEEALYDMGRAPPAYSLGQEDHKESDYDRVPRQ